MQNDFLSRDGFGQPPDRSRNVPVHAVIWSVNLGQRKKRSDTKGTYEIVYGPRSIRYTRETRGRGPCAVDPWTRPWMEDESVRDFMSSC